MLNGVIGRVFPGNVAERKADKSTSDRDGDCKPPTLWLRLVRIDVMTGPADRVDSNNVFVTRSLVRLHFVTQPLRAINS